MSINACAAEADSVWHKAESGLPKVRMDGESLRIREQLNVRLTNSNWESEMLGETPFIEVVPGLAMYCEWMMLSENGEYWRRHISTEMMEQMGMNRKELMGAAIRCSMQRRPPVMLAFEDEEMGTENLLCGESPLENMENAMYILTTRDFMLGAVALFYPGVQERISTLMGGSYYAIPSSIHEFIILPDREFYTYEFLLHMLLSANREILEPGDELSERLYYYNDANGKLVCCERVPPEV